jgi:hypothetical protein
LQLIKYHVVLTDPKGAVDLHPYKKIE